MKVVTKKTKQITLPKLIQTAEYHGTNDEGVIRIVVDGIRYSMRGEVWKQVDAKLESPRTLDGFKLVHKTKDFSPGSDLVRVQAKGCKTNKTYRIKGQFIGQQPGVSPRPVSVKHPAPASHASATDAMATSRPLMQALAPAVESLPAEPPATVGDANDHVVRVELPDDERGNAPVAAGSANPADRAVQPPSLASVTTAQAEPSPAVTAGSADSISREAAAAIPEPHQKADPPPATSEIACAGQEPAAVRLADPVGHPDLEAERERFRVALQHALAMQKLGEDFRASAWFITMYFDISRATLYRRVAKGTLPRAMHDGGKAYWSFIAMQKLRNGDATHRVAAQTPSLSQTT